ncbi:flavin reductase family protein [Pseudarthrobacter oxydans]|uniref:flavin reductase family protein n=1 Tax=Pseudarthrobacter oxydans TaxID=1671 RepID=UPI003D2E0FD8
MTNSSASAVSASAGSAAVLDRPQDMDLQQRVRQAHRSFPSGVTVVTACVDGAPVGLAVNAFSSVSMEPAMVLVCVNSSSQSHQPLSGSSHIGINILGHDQKQTALAFAKSGGDKFSGVNWARGTYGVPVLEGASATFEIQVKERIQAGTHTIFLGEVVDVTLTDKPSLVYSAGSFYDGAHLTDAH